MTLIVLKVPLNFNQPTKLNQPDHGHHNGCRKGWMYLHWRQKAHVKGATPLSLESCG